MSTTPYARLGAIFFVIWGALWRNWRNDRLGYWLNLSVVSWADIVWVQVVVVPGYVPMGVVSSHRPFGWQERCALRLHDDEVILYHML